MSHFTVPYKRLVQASTTFVFVALSRRFVRSYRFLVPAVSCLLVSIKVGGPARMVSTVARKQSFSIHWQGSLELELEAGGSTKARGDVTLM